MTENRYVEYCGLILFIFVCGGFSSVIPDNNQSAGTAVSWIVLGSTCLAFLVVLVLALISCGGFDDMSGDVASENHPACGKQTHIYSPVVGDANTEVLMSSHTIGESANMIAPQNLPYYFQPTQAQGFTGYQSSAVPSAPQAQAPRPGGHRPPFEPPPPSYDQLNQQSSLAGY